MSKAFDRAWRSIKEDEEYDAEKNLEALRAWDKANRPANPPEDPCEACRNLPDDHPDWMKGMCEDCYATWVASMNLRQGDPDEQGWREGME